MKMELREFKNMVTKNEVLVQNKKLEEDLKRLVQQTEGIGNTYIGETMEVGEEGNRFIIKKGSFIQIKEHTEIYDWFDKFGLVVYIANGIAYIKSFEKQEWGLYEIGIWNASKVVEYIYD